MRAAGARDAPKRCGTGLAEKRSGRCPAGTARRGQAMAGGVPGMQAHRRIGQQQLPRGGDEQVATAFVAFVRGNGGGGDRQQIEAQRLRRDIARRRRQRLPAAFLGVGIAVPVVGTLGQAVGECRIRGKDDGRNLPLREDAACGLVAGGGRNMARAVGMGRQRNEQGQQQPRHPPASPACPGRAAGRPCGLREWKLDRHNGPRFIRRRSPWTATARKV